MARRATDWDRPRLAKNVRRAPLPSLHPLLIWAIVLIVAAIVNLSFFVLTGSLLHLVALIAGAWPLMRIPSGHRRIVNKRNAVRAANYERVNDWIIKTDLPKPSPELAAEEALLERLYVEHQAKQAMLMAAKGLDPEGKPLPLRAAPKGFLASLTCEQRIAARARKLDALQDKIMNAHRLPHATALGSAIQSRTKSL